MIDVIFTNKDFPKLRNVEKNGCVTCGNSQEELEDMCAIVCGMQDILRDQKVTSIFSGSQSDLIIHFENGYQLMLAGKDWQMQLTRGPQAAFPDADPTDQPSIEIP